MKKAISILLAMCICISICTTAAFAASYRETQNDLVEKMSELGEKKNALQSQIDQNYSDVVYISGKVIQTTPSVVVEKFSFWEPSYYIVQNVRTFSDGWYRTIGSTIFYYGQTAYSAKVVRPAPQEFIRIQQEISELQSQIDALENKRKDTFMGYINESGAQTNALKEQAKEDTKMVMQVGCPYVYVPDAGYEQLSEHDGSYARGTQGYDWKMVEAGNFEATPIVLNGTTMVPIRTLVETLGGWVNWDAQTNEIGCHFDSFQLKLTIGSDVALVNDVETKITTPVTVHKGKTMVPLRFIAETLGTQVEWVQNGKFIVVSEQSGDWTYKSSRTHPDPAWRRWDGGTSDTQYWQQWDGGFGGISYYYPVDFEVTTGVVDENTFEESDFNVPTPFTDTSENVLPARKFSYQGVGGFDMVYVKDIPYTLGGYTNPYSPTWIDSEKKEIVPVDYREVLLDGVLKENHIEVGRLNSTLESGNPYPPLIYKYTPTYGERYGYYIVQPYFESGCTNAQRQTIIDVMLNLIATTTIDAAVG